MEEDIPPPPPPPPPSPPSPPPPPPPLPEDEEEEGKIYKVVDEMPRFYSENCERLSARERYNCSIGKMIQYINSNLKYPPDAVWNGTEGKVWIEFIVLEDGTLDKIKAIRDDIGEGCGQEGERIIKSMNQLTHKWIPGRHKGKIVKVLFVVPIKFKLLFD